MENGKYFIFISEQKQESPTFSEGYLLLFDLQGANVVRTWSVCSGGHGNGALPSGNYSVSSCDRLEDIKINRAYKGDDYPWFASLTPRGKDVMVIDNKVCIYDHTLEIWRHSFGAHGKGSLRGTLGCIEAESDDVSLCEAIEDILADQKEVLLIVAKPFIRK